MEISWEIRRQCKGRKMGIFPIQKQLHLKRRNKTNINLKWFAFRFLKFFPSSFYQYQWFMGIIWVLNGKDFQSNFRWKFLNFCIEIDFPGIFILPCWTSWWSPSNFLIFITVPPNIDDSLSSSDVIVREGSNVTLKCRAHGSPTPSIKWKRDDNSKININKSLSGNYY